MPWFKVDDKHHDHRKTRRALRGGKKRRDAAAIGLWSLAGSWSADNLMDGFVPTDELLRWDDDGEALAARLVEAEFWEPSERDGERGFQFINWDEHQPTKAEVEAKREAARERMRAVRAKGGRGSGEVRANEQVNNAGSSRDVRSTPSRPVPSRPDPTNRDESATAELVAPRHEVEEICQHLVDALATNGVNRTITTKWRQAARLMLDKDGRTEEEIHGAIDWCQRDEFWRANILSLPTLREKYDTLRLQAQRKSGGTSRTEEWRSMQERQMARAIEREREMGIQR